jgi:polysaccharide pyruvyl transferase WcaK-like protein
VQLARELLARGFDVSLFTNGPHDDEEVLDLVMGAIDDQRVKRAVRPHRPAELAAVIRSFDAVISHRLHANILAYAFRIPHVGCAWDPKVDAFFCSVGRDDFVAELGRVGPAEICTLLERALEQGIDPATHAKVVADTKLAIRACAGAMAASLDRRSQAAAIRDREFGRDATCP